MTRNVCASVLTTFNVHFPLTGTKTDEVAFSQLACGILVGNWLTWEWSRSVWLATFCKWSGSSPSSIFGWHFFWKICVLVLPISLSRSHFTVMWYLDVSLPLLAVVMLRKKMQKVEEKGHGFILDHSLFLQLAAISRPPKQWGPSVSFIPVQNRPQVSLFPGLAQKDYPLTYSR